MNAQTIDYNKLRRQVDTHPYPLVFATISGAHLYGFPSADSDFDLRGVHLLPLVQVVGLDAGEQTVGSRSQASTTASKWTSLRTTPRSSSA
jgi:predicted nucleotidyltransferase